MLPFLHTFYMFDCFYTVYAVMYLQSNPGGITIFGWTVDRGLINTIFFIELSLVTFVLGKTIIDPSWVTHDQRVGIVLDESTWVIYLSCNQVQLADPKPTRTQLSFLLPASRAMSTCLDLPMSYVIHFSSIFIVLLSSFNASWGENVEEGARMR